MKQLKFLLWAVFFPYLGLLYTMSAHADSLTGAWSGTTLGIYEKHIAFLQRGNKVIGSGWSGRAGVIKGSINGTTFTFHSDYAGNYSSDAQSQISGSSMSGTFLDSQNTSGGFTAQKDDTILRSSTVLYSPPIVEVIGGTAKITLIKFTQVSGASDIENGAKIRYDLKVAGRRVISSLSNRFSLTNLGSGSHKVSYRITALRNGNRLFAIAKSPPASFKIK